MDLHKESLRRYLARLSHPKRKDQCDENMSAVDSIDIAAERLEEAGTTETTKSLEITGNFYGGAMPEGTRAAPSPVSSMEDSGSIDHRSKESLIDPSLRGSGSAPMLAPVLTCSLQSGEVVPPSDERPSAHTSRRVDSKLEEPADGRASPFNLSAFDASQLLPYDQSSSRRDPQVRYRSQQPSLAVASPSHVPTPTDMEPPTYAHISLREKRLGQRLSLRSPISFAPGSSNDPYQVLLPLQSVVPENSDAQVAELTNTDDPRSWSIIAPAETLASTGVYALEARAEQLFGADHLRTILEDPKLLFAFMDFLSIYRPWRRRLLDYYWDAIKALRAMNYARAIVDGLSEKSLPCIGRAATLPSASIDANLSEAASEVFDDIVQEDLPAYIAHIYTRIVRASVQRRITGSLSTHLREASHGLAEVFVIADPSRYDSPIILASEEFALTTQYGLKYAIGRNCRFLQGPRTSKHSVRRLAIACAEGKEHIELFVNYRRDGSPFLNLLMVAPLLDSKGNVRYFLGAQVDVSGLLKDSLSVESFHKLLSSETKPDDSCRPERLNRLRAVESLSYMFCGDELDIVRRCGGHLNQGYSHLHDTTSADLAREERTRIFLQEEEEEDGESQTDAESGLGAEHDQKSPSTSDTPQRPFEGVYKNYLVVRPAPSLRILFASAPLRIPGMLQSHFLHRIGGSSKMRHDLEQSFHQGNAVTARVRWPSVPNRYGDGAGRQRWIHCTPLLHHSGAVGLWVVVVVDDDDDDNLVVPSRAASRQAGGSKRMALVDPDLQYTDRLRTMHKDLNRRPDTASMR